MKNAAFKKVMAGMILSVLFLIPVSKVYAGVGTYPGTCPILEDEKTKENVFTEYKGKKIHFCCKRCLKKFEADPEKFAAEVA